MTREPIDFEAQRDKRVVAELDADDARWNTFHAAVTRQVYGSDLHHSAIRLATLKALVELLLDHDATPDEITRHFAQTLRVFFTIVETRT